MRVETCQMYSGDEVCGKPADFIGRICCPSHELEDYYCTDCQEAWARQFFTWQYTPGQWLNCNVCGHRNPVVRWISLVVL